MSKITDLRDELEARTEIADVLVATCNGWKARFAKERERAEKAEAKLAAVAETAALAGLSAGNWETKARNYYARAKQAEAALAERDKPCLWAWSAFDQAWEAGCDGWLFTECHPGDWPRCPRCGRPVELPAVAP